MLPISTSKALGLCLGLILLIAVTLDLAFYDQQITSKVTRWMSTWHTLSGNNRDTFISNASQLRKKYGVTEGNCSGFCHDYLANFSCLQEAELEKHFVSFAIRTTAKFHISRLNFQLQTWIPYAMGLQNNKGDDVVQRVAVITDTLVEQNSSLRSGFDRRLIFRRSGCGDSHDSYETFWIKQAKLADTFFRWPTACKFQLELKSYYQSKLPRTKWFCHVDDDLYVHVPQLISVLHQFNHEHPILLGKPSLSDAFPLKDNFGAIPIHRTVRFANGHSSCLSRALMQLVEPLMTNRSHPLNFLNAIKKHDLNDDVMFSLISIVYLHVQFYKLKAWYSHMDPFKPLTESEALSAIILSYSQSRQEIFKQGHNSSSKEIANDPTGFFNVHQYYREKRTLNICNSLETEATHGSVLSVTSELP